jgi:hypothetical protein
LQINPRATPSQNIYIRKVGKVNGQLYNTEFATYEAVKDPMKPSAK